MDYHLQHLLVELARIELLFQRQIARLQARQSANMGGLVITADELFSLFNDDDLALPDSETETHLAQRHLQIAETEMTLREQADANDEIPRFAALCIAFDLTPFERDVLLICLAPLLDLRYERLFGYLQNDVTLRRPTVNIILELLVESPLTRLRLLPSFLDEGRLFSSRLLQRVHEAGDQPALPNQQLTVDESVLAWLLGSYHPDPRLEECLTLNYPEVGEEERLLTAEVWDKVIEAINGQSVASFHGSDLLVQRTTAQLLAANAELPLLTVDLARAATKGMASVEILRLVLRDARMMGSAIYLHGWDAMMGQLQPPAALLKMLFETTNPLIISSEKEWYAHGVERSDSMLRVAFPKPGYRQRCALWEFYADAAGYELAPDVHLNVIASQFALESQQIQDAVASARDAAIQRVDLIHQRDLITAARVHSSPNLSGLAQKIEPRYEWSDIVLPEDQKAMLQELTQMVRGRGIVMEEWGVGKKLKTSSGVTVLFAGPPGTGKTMSAEVIAGELGLDLYKLDLSMVVSKYIGETEKNLGKIFDEAQSSSAVLFFDEADSIFGKRSEVKDSHDRYANMEISYLLQRMEQYDGITILATNLRANMDEAFTRRMQFIVDFPFPDAEERLYIWQTLFPSTLPKSGDIDLSLLATRFKLAGGNIRNIIASAAFLAASNGGVVTMEHLLHGTRRELQKMGRLISDVDLTF
ncbi:MAG: ATP-binding protein [Caldilineaceae bacterium]|nr:ATP-binding protein [Caldilineaceae bacterium]